MNFLTEVSLTPFQVYTEFQKNFEFDNVKGVIFYLSTKKQNSKTIYR